MSGPENLNKPPYRVPSMEEIGQIPWNGYRAISTFSGCGGSCLGLRMAGFKVLWASEFIPAAQEVYRLNHPDSILDTNDIRAVQPEDILAQIGLDVGELDLLDGSPPCASFSTAGKREKKWGQVTKYSDTTQRVDDLFFEFARIVRGLQPKVFIAENVSGLVKGTAKGHFKYFLQTFKECGYTVQAVLLNAKWLGVPQNRERLFFQGVRKDLNLPPSFPVPLPYTYTVKEAIPWIDKAIEDTGGQWAAGDITHREALTVRQGGVGQLKIIEPQIESLIPSYLREWKKTPIGKNSHLIFNLSKVSPYKACPTVVQSGGKSAGIVHPFEARRFTIEELKRICAFPDDFQLTGSYAQQWERLGRAVPPVMMFHLASAIRDQVLAQCAAS